MQSSRTFPAGSAAPPVIRTTKVKLVIAPYIRFSFEGDFDALLSNGRHHKNTFFLAWVRPDDLSVFVAAFEVDYETSFDHDLSMWCPQFGFCVERDWRRLASSRAGQTLNIDVIVNEFRNWCEHGGSELPYVLYMRYFHVTSLLTGASSSFIASKCKMSVSTTKQMYTRFARISAYDPINLHCFIYDPLRRYLIDSEYTEIAYKAFGIKVDIPESVTVSWAPPKPEVPEPPTESQKVVAEKFINNLDEYFAAPYSPRNMAASSVGSFLSANPKETLILGQIERRNALLPSQWLSAITVKNVVFPFPKTGGLRSDGTARTVYSMDVSLDAYYRQKIGLRERPLSYQLFDIHKTPTDAVSGWYVYDLRHCDEQMGRVLWHSKYNKLLPYIYHDEMFYRSSSWPSGTLFTSAFTQMFSEAILQANNIPGNEAYIAGDTIISKNPLNFFGFEYRNERDIINGFVAEGSRWRYTRRHRLFAMEFVRAGKVSGALRWMLRAVAYLQMGVEIPQQMLEQVDKIVCDTYSFSILNSTTQQIMHFLHERKLAIPRSFAKAFNLTNLKFPGQNPDENVLTTGRAITVPLPYFIFINE